MNRFWTLLLAASCLTAVSLRSTAQSLDEPHTFYQSDFSQNDFDGWSTTQTIEYDNRILLGNFSNETCSLTLSCLPAHTSLQLTFDVYALDTWDGNGSTGGPNDPDLWFASIEGNTLIETTFGHAFGVPQSYPANYPAHNDPFSGATQQCLETFCYGQNCASAQYSMSFTLEHSLSNAEIIFGADLLQDICDESWALGDVAVSLIGFVETPVAMGCTDSLACNFSEESTCDDGSCHFNCQFCHEGTVWDEDLFKCVVANPSDSNFDGCVQLNDLLDLLSAYGDCGAEESPWLCGDPLEYQGYGYETVQIGEQCWFAENLRSADYLNGEAIQSDLSSESWSSATEGAKTVYGEGPFCFDVSPNFDACNSTVAYAELGHLYNWRAVSDSRGVCPNSWKVPSDEDWTVMIDFVGGIFEGGHVLKATDGWAYNGGGSDSVQFAGLPGGQRLASGDFTGAGGSGFWWSSTPTLTDAWHRILVSDSNTITRSNTTQSTGMSIRCIKD